MLFSKWRKTLLAVSVFLMSLYSATGVAYAIPAFPGAEGFGAVATGGRGGGVYIVDSLSGTTEAGKTTLRDCVEDKNNYGARTCVFAVGGIIELASDLEITKPNITIAGQTAPGGGITLKSVGAKNLITVNTSQVIIRYLRMRNGLNCENCRAFRIMESDDTKYVIADHNSFSWSADELVIIWDAATHTTLQWNSMADSFRVGTGSSVQAKGPNLGGWAGGGFHTIVNNVIANMHQRNPRLRNYGGVVDVVNNLIYNPGDDGSVISDSGKANFIGNYVKSGQDTTETRYLNPNGDGKEGLGGKGSDFVYEENTKLESYNGGGITNIVDVCSDTAFSEGSCKRLLTQRNPSEGLASVTITSPDQAYQDILVQAGASAYVSCSGQFVGRRDLIDQKLFQEIADNTGRIKDTINDTLKFVPLDQGTPCLDTDKDGMPDEYETAKGLNKTDANDGKALTSSGYSNLEVYVNGSGEVSATPTPSPSPSISPSPTPSPSISPSPSASPLPTLLSDIAPLNNPDGKVNIFDFNLLLENFGRTGAEGFHPADIIKNGEVDIFDYNKLLSEFGV